MSEQMIDLFTADHIEVLLTIDGSGSKLWVNVDGKCMFRAYRIKEIEVVDNRVIRED